MVVVEWLNGCGGMVEWLWWNGCGGMVEWLWWNGCGGMVVVEDLDDKM